MTGRPPRRPDRAFSVRVMRMLTDRAMTQAALAGIIEVSPATLSRSLSDAAFSGPVRARLERELAVTKSPEAVGTGRKDADTDRLRLLHLLREALEILSAGQ